MFQPVFKGRSQGEKETINKGVTTTQAKGQVFPKPGNRTLKMHYSATSQTISLLAT